VLTVRKQKVLVCCTEENITYHSLRASRDSTVLRHVSISKALAQVAQIGGGCPVLGNIQDQAGWGSEQRDVAVGVPVHCRAVGLDDL